MVSATLWAATLTVSDNLIVTEIDNNVVEHGFIGKNSKFSLNQGEHALIVHYKDVFEDLEFAEDRVVKSQEFVVKFNITQEKQLMLVTTDIKNLTQAESFSKSPELILKDENNKQLNIALENVSDYKIAQQVDIAVSSYASKQAIEKPSEKKIAKTVAVTESAKLVTAPVAKITTVSPVITPNTNNTLIQVNSLTMLKYWWKNASDEEKIHFKQYITTKK